MLQHVLWLVPAGFGDDHLCAEIVELVPQFLRLQTTLYAFHLLTVAMDTAAQRRHVIGQ